MKVIKLGFYDKLIIRAIFNSLKNSEYSELLKNRFKFIMVYIGDMQGDIVAAIEIEDYDKILLIQLSYGTCEICDPIEGIVEKFKEENNLDCIDRDNIPEELIERISKEIIDWAILVIPKDKLFEKELTVLSLIGLIKERIEQGLMPYLSGDIVKIVKIDSIGTGSICSYSAIDLDSLAN
jgi:hypothetical protein